MTRAEEIETRLRAAFAPTELVIRNDSARHAGHAGRMAIPPAKAISTCACAPRPWPDLNRLARHRAVHGALGPDLTRDIHALSLDLDA